MDEKLIDLEDKDNRTIGVEGELVRNVDTSWVAKHITVGQFAYLLEVMLNSMARSPFRDGVKIGKILCQAHRTLQGCAVNFALGILVGFASTEYTDARNEKAIELAKKVKDIVDLDGVQPLI